MNNNPLKSKEIFLYGILGIPIAFLGFPLYIYLPSFYVEHIGLSIGVVGFVLLIARLIDMIADPFIGRFCDIYSSKFNIIFISSFFLLFGLFFLIKNLQKLDSLSTNNHRVAKQYTNPTKLAQQRANPLSLDHSLKPSLIG